MKKKDNRFVSRPSRRISTFTGKGIGKETRVATGCTSNPRENTNLLNRSTAFPVELEVSS